MTEISQIPKLFEVQKGSSEYNNQVVTSPFYDQYTSLTSRDSRAAVKNGSPLAVVADSATTETRSSKGKGSLVGAAVVLPAFIEGGVSQADGVWYAVKKFGGLSDTAQQAYLRQIPYFSSPVTEPSRMTKLIQRLRRRGSEWGELPLNEVDGVRDSEALRNRVGTLEYDLKALFSNRSAQIPITTIVPGDPRGYVASFKTGTGRVLINQASLCNVRRGELPVITELPKHVAHEVHHAFQLRVLAEEAVRDLSILSVLSPNSQVPADKVVLFRDLLEKKYMLPITDEYAQFLANGINTRRFAYINDVPSARLEQLEASYQHARDFSISIYAGARTRIKTQTSLLTKLERSDSATFGTAFLTAIQSNEPKFSAARKLYFGQDALPLQLQHVETDLRVNLIKPRNASERIVAFLREYIPDSIASLNEARKVEWIKYFFPHELESNYVSHLIEQAELALVKRL